MNAAYSPLEVAIALSLYAYNVSVAQRAKKLWDCFDGDCMELPEIIDILLARPAYIATELPLPTASAYVQHALELYGSQARQRATYL